MKGVSLDTKQPTDSTKLDHRKVSEPLRNISMSAELCNGYNRAVQTGIAGVSVGLVSLVGMVTFGGEVEDWSDMDHEQRGVSTR